MLTLLERQRWEAIRRTFSPPLAIPDLVLAASTLEPFPVALEPSLELVAAPDLVVLPTALEPEPSPNLEGVSPALPASLDWNRDQPIGLFLAGLAWEVGQAGSAPLASPGQTQAATAREFLARLPWSGPGESALSSPGLPSLMALATSSALAAARRRAEPANSTAAFLRNLPWNLPIGA